MSKIQAILAAATEINPSARAKETITTQEYMKRLALAVTELPDEEWEKLNPEVQDWFSKAADAIEAKLDIPEFPDMAPTPTAGGRRRSAAAETVATYVPKEGDDGVTVTTKRGTTYVGKIKILDDEGLVLVVDGKDVELDKDKIESYAMGGAVEAGAAEPEGPSDPEVGDTVQCETKRGAVKMGIVVELTDSEITLKDVGGELHDFTIANLKSLVVKLKGGATPAATGRRGAAAPAPAPSADAPKTRASTSANGGVSVTTRIRELIADNPEATKDQISTSLKKEGLEFKPATVDLTFGDMHKIIGILRMKKLMK